MAIGLARTLAAGLGGFATLALASPAAAQFGGCDREQLQTVADAYIEAQTAGEAGKVPMGLWVTYRENRQLNSMSTGLLSQPLKIDWHRALLDTGSCSVFIEAIVTNPAHPYVIHSQLSARGGAVGNYDVIVTDEGDWLFDAAHTLKYARHEDWPVIPEDKRNSRKELIAAADAYLDLFKDKSVRVPWGTPCARLEGGIYSGKGKPDDSCNVGVPDGIDLVNRSYVVDETIGAVDVFLNFGNEDGPADSHLFRIEDGKIRFVHTATNCGDQPNCGFPPLKDMLKDNPGMQPDLDD